MTDTVWTIGKLLTWAQGWLERRGAGSPRLDAELLLAAALGVQRLDLYLQFDRPCDGDELAAFKALVLRRGAGEPVAYILGRKGFHAIELKVGPGVLVPRPETEWLVDCVLEWVKRTGASGPVADIGTGSGAIALALAHAWRELPEPPRIIATDASDVALRYARENAEKLGLSQHVQCVHGEGLAAAAEFGPFSAIVSNPPYVLTGTLPGLQVDVREHEPTLALDGGIDGLRVLRAIAKGARALLRQGGLLAVELGSPHQGQVLIDTLAESGLGGGECELVGPGPTAVVTVNAPTREPMLAVV